MSLNIFVEPELFSALALGVRTNGDPYLAPGVHLRWTLAPGLGLPRRGFVVKRRLAPVWPWQKGIGEPVYFSDGRSRQSARGVHSNYAPLFVEGARSNADGTLGGTTLTFRYEPQKSSDPKRAPWVRFAVLLSVPLAQSLVTLIARVLHPDGSFAVAELQTTASKLPAAGTGSIVRVAIISAPAMDEVVLRLPTGGKVHRIEYVGATEYAGLRNWDTIATLGAPVKGDGRTVPLMANPAETAKSRLRRARPLRYAGTKTWAGDLPPLATSRDHEAMEQALGQTVPELSELISAAFNEELTAPEFPGRIMLDDLAGLAADDGGDTQGGLQAPVHAILAASAQDPAIAAILGLAYRDLPPNAAAVYDYAVEAVMPVLWLGVVMGSMPIPEGTKLNPIDASYLVPPLTGDVETLTHPYFIRLASLVPDISQQTPPPPLPEIAIRATVTPRPSAHPVPAVTRIEIHTTPDRRPGSLTARSLLWRRDGTGESALNDTHPLTGHLVPFAARAADSPVVDDGLTRTGPTTYRAVAVDLFGRASVGASETVEVRDLTPPPPPTALTLKIGVPDPARPETFPAAEAAFVWPTSAAAQAPDTTEFELLWKAGHHDAATIAAAPDGRLRQPWPAPSARQTATADGPRITLALGQVTGVKSGPRHEVSAVVIARDSHGNNSPPSLPAYDFHYADDRPAAPAQPDAVIWASWPAADKLCRWRCRWPAVGAGSFTRVSSALESRLLHLAGIDPASYRQLPLTERAGRLRALALSHPQAFTPETTQPVPHTVDHVDISIASGSESLKLVVVEHVGASGQKAPWPSDPKAFAVIAARSLGALPPPRVSAKPLDAIVSVTIDASLSPPGTLRIYRLTQAEAEADLRALRPAFVVENSNSHRLRDEHSPASDWVGYTAVVVAADGRISPPAPIVWTKAKAAFTART